VAQERSLPLLCLTDAVPIKAPACFMCFFCRFFDYLQLAYLFIFLIICYALWSLFFTCLCLLCQEIAELLFFLTYYLVKNWNTFAYVTPGEVNTSEMLVNMSAGSLEDFYPAIAIAILMRYIRDPSLSQHHRTVVQAITFIFKSLGSKCIPYLSQVVPAYLHVIRASEAIFREVYCLLLNVK